MQEFIPYVIAARIHDRIGLASMLDSSMIVQAVRTKGNLTKDKVWTETVVFTFKR